MTLHEELFGTVQRLCRARGSWTFSADEVVRALPHLNENSVRTHISSRCCVNAPAHHAHRWPYFRRLARGQYEVARRYRSAPAPAQVAESAPSYGRAAGRPARETIHAVLQYDGTCYTAECLEVAVVTQGRTADEVLTNLQDAIALHLDGEDLRALGLARALRLLVTYEVPVRWDAAEA